MGDCGRLSASLRLCVKNPTASASRGRLHWEAAPALQQGRGALATSKIPSCLFVFLCALCVETTGERGRVWRLASRVENGRVCRLLSHVKIRPLTKEYAKFPSRASFFDSGQWLVVSGQWRG